MPLSNREAPRLATWQRDFGTEYAKARARRAMVAYRQACLYDANLKGSRRSLIESYLEMKRFLRTGEVEYEWKTSKAYQRLLGRNGDTKDTPGLQKDEATPEESIQNND